MSTKNPTEDELLEILFRFKETNNYSPYDLAPVKPIDLSNKQIKELAALLSPNSACDYCCNQLAVIARCFCRDLWFQNQPPHAQIKSRLTNIQTSAHKILREFNATDKRVRAFVQEYMQRQAGRYGTKMKEAYPHIPHTPHWNFWTAHRLPSAIQSVELLEHWAGLAIAQFESENRRNPKIKKVKTKKGREAARKVIGGLAEIWQRAHGQLPGAGEDGPFVRFAQAFVRAMQLNITDQHTRLLPSIRTELNAMTSYSIAGHTRTYNSNYKRRSAHVK